MIIKDTENSELNEGDRVVVALPAGAMPGKILKITGGLALATGQNHPPLIHVAIIIPIPVEQSGLVGGIYKLASSETVAPN